MKIYITDIGDHGDFASKFPIEATGVPAVGSTINLYEILTEERRKEHGVGWWYKVLSIEWSMREGEKVLEPFLKVARKNIYEE